MLHGIKDIITKRQRAWINKGHTIKYKFYCNSKVRKTRRRAPVHSTTLITMVALRWLKHTQNINPKKWRHNIEFLASRSL